MRKLLLGIVGLVVLVAIAGGIAYAGGVVRGPELDSITLSWGQVTSSTTTIDATIGINNRLPFGIGAGSIGVKMPVYINDVRAAQLDIPGLNLPKGLSNLQASATLVQTNLPGWWPAFVQQGEKLSVRVQPQVSARVAGVTFLTRLPDIQTEVPVPIMSNMRSTEPVTMGFDNATPLQIAQRPGEHFVASPPSPSPARPVLTVESWNLRWGDVTEQRTQVLGTLVLRNELTVPIPIQGLRIGLDMNGIPVVPDVDLTPARAELPPGQSVPLALEANVDNGKLVEWWTSHIQRAESTVVAARVGITIVLPGTSTLGLTQALVLPLMPVPVLEARIHTNILGMANYQIAQMLGKANGPQPKAVEVEVTTKPAEMGSVVPLPSGPSGLPVLLPTPPSPAPPTPVLPTPTVPTPTATPIAAATPTATSIPVVCILNVSVTPAGSGSVMLSPPGGSYPSGTVVTLIATPSVGYAFDQWGGNASGTSTAITIIMDSDKSITAYFKRVLP